MDATGRAIKIGQSEFHCPCHACAFFNSRDEEYELLLPFSKSGAEAGERLFQVVDKAHLAERRRRLAEQASTSRERRAKDNSRSDPGRTRICAETGSTRTPCWS